MTPADHTAVITSYIDAYNNYDVEAMLSVIHEGIVFKNVYGGEVNAVANGIDELRELANRAKGMFASRREVITSFESSVDFAKVGIDFSGMLLVDLPNGMKAGETLHIKGRSEFEFRDGKLYRITDYS